jgi:hypothetical protein
MATAIKKPAAKSAAKAATPAPKKAATPAVKAPPKPAFEPKAGDYVQFTGYAPDKMDEPVFEVGQQVLVAEVLEDETRGTMYVVCLNEEERDKHLKGETIDGDELMLSEIGPVKAPAVPKVVVDPHEQFKFRDDAELTSMLAQGDPIETSLTLYQDIQRKFYYLGGLLTHIYTERKYIEQGYTDEAHGGKTYAGFNAFCKEKYGFSGRKGLELIQIYSSFSLLDNVDLTKLAKVGYSKAIFAAKFVNQENVDEILEKAESTPILELKERLRIDYTDADGNAAGSGTSATRQRSAPAKVKLEYTLFADQAEQIKMVFNEARKKFGKKSDGEILEHIITEWANEFLGEQEQAKIQKVAAKTAKTIGRPTPKIGKPVAA